MWFLFSKAIVAALKVGQCKCQLCFELTWFCSCFGSNVRCFLPNPWLQESCLAKGSSERFGMQIGVWNVRYRNSEKCLSLIVCLIKTRWRIKNYVIEVGSVMISCNWQLFAYNRFQNIWEGNVSKQKIKFNLIFTEYSFFDQNFS